MAETKTKPTGASVDAYLASRASPEQLADCKAIMAMCKRVTKQRPYPHPGDAQPARPAGDDEPCHGSARVHG
jgi:hypothetical protein